MVIRFKVPFDNGTVKCEAGETTSDLDPAYAARIVRAGLAEIVPGNRGLNTVRAEMGLPPVATASMTKAELIELARDQGVPFETDDNKADLVAKINAAARND